VRTLPLAHALFLPRESNDRTAAWAGALGESVAAAFDANAPGPRVERMLQRERDGDFDALERAAAASGSAAAPAAPAGSTAPEPADGGGGLFVALQKALVAPAASLLAALPPPAELFGSGGGSDGGKASESLLPWKRVRDAKHAEILEHMVRELARDERNLTQPPPPAAAGAGGSFAALSEAMSPEAGRLAMVGVLASYTFAKVKL
jgi:hypothetical protein